MENTTNQTGGPKTPEGKLISSKNSTKHGILSKAIILHSENPEEFNEFYDEIIEDIKPKGSLEHHLANYIAVNLWRLKRIISFEEKIANENDRYIIDGTNIENILRYEVTMKRNLFKTLEKLKESKEARGADSTGDKQRTIVIIKSYDGVEEKDRVSNENYETNS